jgi:hypothetical protein
LDAGSAIAVTGPAGSLSLSSTIAGQTIVGSYFPPSAVSIDFVPAGGGSFTFDNGSGGKDVQHFNATVNMPPVLTWTNQAQIASVTRSQGVNVTWSGGAPGTFVGIAGTSTLTIAAKFVSVSFFCYAPIGAGQFSVPPPVLLALPAGGGGGLTVSNFNNLQQFTAAGLDLGLMNGGSSTTKVLAFN